jgi:hypothetical protein
MHENPVRDFGPLAQMAWLQHLSVDEKSFTKEQGIALKKALKNTEIAFY